MAPRRTLPEGREVKEKDNVDSEPLMGSLPGENVQKEAAWVRGFEERKTFLKLSLFIRKDPNMVNTVIL